MKTSELLETVADDPAFLEASETAVQSTTQVVEQQEEELAWEVDDAHGSTVFVEDLGCLQTTLADGIVIGWDTCGCGRSVITCGCEVIRLPRYVIKLQEVACEAVGDRCGSCGALLYTNGTCPNCDRPAKAL